MRVYLSSGYNRRLSASVLTRISQNRIFWGWYFCHNLIIRLSTWSHSVSINSQVLFVRWMTVLRKWGRYCRVWGPKFLPWRKKIGQFSLFTPECVPRKSLAKALPERPRDRLSRASVTRFSNQLTILQKAPNHFGVSTANESSHGTKALFSPVSMEYSPFHLQIFAPIQPLLVHTTMWNHSLLPDCTLGVAHCWSIFHVDSPGDSLSWPRGARNSAGSTANELLIISSIF